jgi:tetratricopeptide (TPR) repeat protein
MGIVQSLSVLVLRHMAISASRALGVIGVDSAVEFLNSRFTDSSRLLPGALQNATGKAWHALEIALAGESLWNKLDDADDRAFRQQLRVFLDNAPLDELPARDAEFRTHCLRELRVARKSGLLQGGTIDAAELARQGGALAHFGDQAGLVEREWAALDDVANLLREGGQQNLARLVAFRPNGGQLPLLAVAVRYFFRRAVETDAELHRGLSFAQWEALAENQRRGFEQLGEALDVQGRRLDELLDLMGEVREAVLDLRHEIAGQRDQIRQLAQDVMQVLGQHQLERRELRGGDSLSIRTDEERRLVRDLVHRYRGLPPEQRRQMPALLNAVGKMQVVAGNFDDARQDFQELVQITPDERGKAEAFFNAYQAALECRKWDDALNAYRQAVSLDPQRFALFPLSKYEPERILGAGGFGVAFLCKDRHTTGRVVVKSIRVDGLDRSVTEVFAEARALEDVQDESIIRLRHCDYAGAGNAHPYLVMDYFEAMTLAELIAQQGPLPQTEAVALVARVARALQKAHARGICHRDVKPANILVANGSVKLIDFGLALRQQMVQTTLGAASSYTQTLIGSSIAGTIDYAAPEQLGKRPGDKIGPHSDVYGLGKTACFALFGTTMPLARHWRSVPAELADLLGQCLAEDPRERPGSCQEVADRLTGVASVAPMAIPLPLPEPVKAVAAEEKPPDPMPHLIVGGILGAIAGLLAGVQPLWQPTGDGVLVAMLFVAIMAGLAATVGRRQHKLTRSIIIPGLGPVAFILSLPMIYAMFALLGRYAFWMELHSPTFLSLLCMTFFLGVVWMLGYLWGRLFGQTVAVMAALSLITLFGAPTMSPAFFFGGLIIGAAAALAFEVATPLRRAEEAVDRAFLIVLEPPALWLSGKPRRIRIERPRLAPATSEAAGARREAHQPPSTAWQAFRLPALLIAGGLAGMALGVGMGAAWYDVTSNDHGALIPIVVGLGGSAGAFLVLLARIRGFSLLLWIPASFAISCGLLALTGALGWDWGGGPIGLMIGVFVWGTTLGTLAGVRLDHPVAGLVGGGIVSTVILATSWLLAHPDPAGLACIPVGLFAGTLLWSGIPTRWLFIARAGAAALFVGLLGIVWLFQPELGTPGVPFGDPVDNRKSSRGAIGRTERDWRSSFTPVSGTLIAISKDGRRLMVEQQGSIQLWDTVVGRQRDTNERAHVSLLTVAFQNDVPVCLGFESTGEAKGEKETGHTRLYNVETGVDLVSGPPIPNPNDGKSWIQNRVTAAADDERVVVIHTGSKPEQDLDLFQGQSHPTTSVVDVPGSFTTTALFGDRMLLGFEDGTIRLAQLTSSEKKVLHETKKLGGPIIRIGYSPSGRWAYAISGTLATRESVMWGRNGISVLVWNAEEWRDFFTVAPCSGAPTCASFLHSDDSILIGTNSGRVERWNCQTQEHVRTSKLYGSFFLSRPRGIRELIASPDGVHVLAVPNLNEGRIIRWQIR